MFGVNVNVDKTEAYWLGKDHKSPPAKLLSVKKVNKPIKILGIYFTYDEELKLKLNYEHVIHSIEKTLNLWKCIGNGEISLCLEKYKL